MCGALAACPANANPSQFGGFNIVSLPARDVGPCDDFHSYAPNRCADPRASCNKHQVRYQSERGLDGTLHRRSDGSASRWAMGVLGQSLQGSPLAAGDEAQICFVQGQHPVDRWAPTVLNFFRRFGVD